MTTFDAELREYALNTFNYYNSKWGDNFLLSRRFNEENRVKVLIALDVLKKNFNTLNKVYVCHTSDSTGMLFGLRRMFDCNITVLTNHPLFERMHSYYNDTLGNIEYKKVDCAFDNCFEHTIDGDVVIFPDMEYFVPLSLKQPPSIEQKIFCVYYVDDFNTITQQNLILCDEEAEELFSFKQTIDFYKEKNSTGRYCYCGLGTL